MDRVAAAVTARLRAVLAVLAGATAVALVPVLATTTSPSVLMVAAAATVVATLVVTHRVPVTPLNSSWALPVRRAGDVPALRTARVTDSPHHPLLPRAPGPV